jgi:hypothetical protein
MVEKIKYLNRQRIRKLILILWPFIAALLVFISVRIAVGNSAFVEDYYSEGIYPHIAQWFSWFSNLFPFSLWDLFWMISILLTISGLFLVIIRKVKFVRYGLRVGQFLAILYCFFYIVWGFNYFRPVIEERLEWKRPETDEAVFRSILDTLIVNTNSEYISVSVSDFSEINRSVEESYRKNSNVLGINYPNGSRRTKTMIFSSFLAKSGVSGYFGPFFNEVHLNHYLLPMDYAFALAHEKAHQFGITNEAEANLAAFAVCISSEDQRLQYSGYMFILLYFLADATHMKGYDEYLKKIDKPVIEDLRFRRDYYEGLQNKTLDNAQNAVNNAYLKANHIEQGVKNYNQVVALVISWYYNSDLISEKKQKL